MPVPLSLRAPRVDEGGWPGGKAAWDVADGPLMCEAGDEHLSWPGASMGAPAGRFTDMFQATWLTLGPQLPPPCLADVAYTLGG